MTIRALRILPPLAIGRLGSAMAPLHNFTMVESEEHPLDYRRIVPQETLLVDKSTGAISGSLTPESITFKDSDGRIRPVAPFLEVFALVDGSAAWQPLTLDLLKRLGHDVADLSWRVTAANRKVERRTANASDRVEAHTGWFSQHEPQRLAGHCPHFIAGASIDFGRVQFIKPTTAYPEIRFRFLPAKGLIYGPNLSPAEMEQLKKENPDIYSVPEEQRIYDQTKGWYKFEPPAGNALPSHHGRFVSETLPPSLFSIFPPAPCWLNDNIAISRGYFDDACDGIVEVALQGNGAGGRLTAVARITSGPPMLVPDSLFVRNLSDDLDQVIFGPKIPSHEPHSETRARAEDIIRRAFETVRFLNVAVMNGNPVSGRDPLEIDTMPAEEAFDVLRPMRPVFSERTADTLAIMRLHQQVFATLRAGAAPWFPDLLRRPEDVADFTDTGRRKMPALMCGADGSYLALTHRQINTIARAAHQPLDMDNQVPDLEADPPPPVLKARNLSAQRHQDVNFVARGNPVSSRPVTSVGNCTPGLEMDFRAVWRRVFEGIELREYDNLVMQVDDPTLAHLKGCRLLRVRYDTESFFTMTTAIGPSPADPAGQSVVYATDLNPLGLAPLEWSNALARMLHDRTGQTVTGDFTKIPTGNLQQPWNDDRDSYVSHHLKVRQFFEDDTAVISRVLAEAGELTQGLCSPWQNDYRECSCYYWASARPDFVNVEPTSSGASSGDNWLQKKRTGDYIPDDYVDSRMVLYDDLFNDWEKWLRFAIGGKDAPGESQG
jgi:hypothetical protein